MLPLPHRSLHRNPRTPIRRYLTPNGSSDGRRRDRRSLWSIFNLTLSEPQSRLRDKLLGI